MHSLASSPMRRDAQISACRAKVGVLKRCTVNAHSWLLHNGLQLNPKKSEVIRFTGARLRGCVDDVSRLEQSPMPTSNRHQQSSVSARHPRPTVDLRLQHFATPRRHDSFTYALCDMCVTNCISDDVAKTVACSTISSHVSVEVTAVTLQRVQRVVLRRSIYEHTTPALLGFHRLPVKFAVLYKLATLTYRIRQSGQPTLSPRTA